MAMAMIDGVWVGQGNAYIDPEVEARDVEALLARVDQPAFVLRADGAVVDANAAGWTMSASEEDLSFRLRAAMGAAEPLEARRGTKAVATILIVRLGTREPLFLALASIPRPAPVERGAIAAFSWGLTPRQTEVASLVVEGLANKEIAERLGCTVGTIELHLTRIYTKAGVTSRSALSAAFWRLSC